MTDRRLFVIVVKLSGYAAALALVILGSLFLASCSSSPGEDTPTSVNVSTAQPPPTGQQIFASNCAACHGAGGEGQPDWHIKKADGTLPPPPLNGDGHTWHHADGLLYRIVSQGGALYEEPGGDAIFKSAMPAFGDILSHEEIIAVLTYIKELWGDRMKLGLSIRESQAMVSEQDPFPPDGG